MDTPPVGDERTLESARAVSAREAILRTVFADLDVSAFAKASGLLCGLLLFFASSVLLLQPATEGQPVGDHLSHLALVLPGYSVTWHGALIGGVYGIVIGALVGVVLATLWNLSKFFYLRLAMAKAQLRALLGEAP